MNKSNILIKNEFGWKINLQNENELFFKGYIYNYTIDELFKKLYNLNYEDTEYFINNIDGQFAFVFKNKFFTIICVDKVRSIPLFYTISDEKIYIDSQAKNLVEIKNLTYQDIDSNQLLCFHMSGYTIGRKTLYKQIMSLKAGEILITNHENSVRIITYNRYEPWNIINKDYVIYEEELSQVTISIFKKMISSLNGRQVVIPLSAGNDSRLVASGLKHLGYENVLCYSYGTKGNFESKIAKTIANKLGYKFVFIEMTHKNEKKYYNSKEYHHFLKFADTCSSIQFIQSITTIKFLKENNLIDNDAIFINGNSGDFISGGHILGKVQDDNSKLSDIQRLDIILNQIIKKHFTLWGYLKTEDNILKIKDLLQKELKNENIILDSINHDHGIYEYLEFINRQSKYVITGQRVYEFYGYEWRLPLWDDKYLTFWEKVPKEYKINQKLYKNMLKSRNLAGVWKEDIPVNKYDIVPKCIIPIRVIFKVFFTLLGSKGKLYWYNFEVTFLQYWMDVIHMSDAVGYGSMIKSFFKQPRNALSLLVENYINKLREKHE